MIISVLNLLYHFCTVLEAEHLRLCTEAVKGLSEHTVCKLVTQGKVHYIRTGEGKCGKILISKKSLLDYLNGAA